MTGEQILTLVRQLTNEHDIGSWHQIHRALRRYCRETGFPWLRNVDDAALTFLADTTEYLLADLELRRIDRVWIQDDTTSRWLMLEERDPESFETAVTEWRKSDGTDDTDRPIYWKIEGSILTVTPTPDQSYNGRIDGIVNTPVVERTKTLPGPEEYHELVARLAAGYHVQDRAQRILEEAKTDIDLAKSQQLFAVGKNHERGALTEIADFLVRDSKPNRMTSLQWDKTPLMK